MRRARLVDAGYDLLAGGGPSAVTVRAVCERANLTSRYFYEHFARPEALIDEIVATESEAIFSEVLVRALAVTEGPHAVVRAGIGAMLDAVDDDRRRAQLGLLGGTDASMLRVREVLIGRMVALTADHVGSVWPDAPADEVRVMLASRLCVRGAIELILAWLGGTTEMSENGLVNLATDYVVRVGTLVFEAGVDN